LHQALPLAAHAASPFLQARVLTVLADAWTQAGNTIQARACLTQVSQLHDQLCIPEGHQARARAQALAARFPGSAGDDPV
jgi:hypothetical protein